MNKKQASRYVWLVNALNAHGLSETEVQMLLKAERTLHRWSERECGDSNEWADWCIERDEETGKPYEVRNVYAHDGRGSAKTYRHAIPDRETPALKRAKEITERHGLTFYHQGDPRGCALWVIRPGDIPAGSTVDSCYTRGIAICID